ncbi:hypothetical protein HCN44_008038 [Aphidius gifuensis]|uniref:tRNA (cytosine(38)-C(5))-methyltransferase n=1 Tax=Aphidius gifuensis TaxID=684658 RepID=A0A834XQ55_APHGI|nr:tRNA (cytosine(38)-C(5))-methyltransferase [Aphidius gifuensis]KAF7989364.1 hypothetical protein HCN44_008038 [Aphidius gifuensis]
MKMRILELYSGIGGMHYALKESGVPGEIIAAIEINTIANSVYKHNHPSTNVLNKNIEALNLDDIKELNIDTILMSPPCQPFTRVGLQKDKADARTNSLFQVLEIIKNLSNLNYIILENVVGFEKSETRDFVIKAINDSFNYKELILSPCQFGVPNSRRRYYLLAKRKGLKFIFNDSSLVDNIPQQIQEILPRKFTNDMTLKDFISLDDLSDENMYLIPENTLEKRFNVLDIRSPDSKGSCCFTKAYPTYAEGTGSVYSPLSSDTVKKITKDLKIHNDKSNDNMELIKTLKLRYFSPKQVSQLMCFPDDFTFPNDITKKQKYRLLGNSINVHVVSQLIYLLNQQ